MRSFIVTPSLSKLRKFPTKGIPDNRGPGGMPLSLYSSHSWFNSTKPNRTRKTLTKVMCSHSQPIVDEGSMKLKCKWTCDTRGREGKSKFQTTIHFLTTNFRPVTVVFGQDHEFPTYVFLPLISKQSQVIVWTCSWVKIHPHPVPILM